MLEKDGVRTIMLRNQSQPNSGEFISLQTKKSKTGNFKKQKNVGEIQH